MLQTPFHAYYKARLLEQLPEEEQFIPVFASSDIEIYPFQIAAASFALRSPYQKGAVLCDEAGMGKSHEAMLVINQKWLEGCSRILLVIPNADLLHQWTEMLERFYTVPYVVLTSRKEWQARSAPDHPNAFIQDAIVITTYDFAADNEEAAKVVNWDLTVFEEANSLSPVYQEDNKQAKALKRLAGDSFKLLLTGTPIEKNIMDLYGLIWFIDETLLPGEKEFLARYLRRPENYPELSEQVSRYCFRTLRSQAKHYAKVTERVLLTVEYTPSKAERQLYELLYAAAIIFFTFFYTALVFNPRDVAENLKKSGAFIPGIRPGEQTARFIDKVMTRLTLSGALYMVLVCLVPQLLMNWFNVQFYFGGTSLLIIVVVIMDFVAQLQSHRMNQQYGDLMRKANLRNYGR